MIYFIKGNLHSLIENRIIVENNGIGYEIYVSGKTLSKLPASGSELFIYTYYQVRDDGVSLFGFLTKEEQSMFNMLISVSGIGPKSAVNMLSEISPSELMVAIISDDVKTMCKLPGIGKKTAARVILELKDKMKTADAVSSQFENAAEIGLGTEGSDAKSDAVAALVSLGYGRSEAFKAVVSVWAEGMSAENIIKLALKAFTSAK